MGVGVGGAEREHIWSVLTSQGQGRPVCKVDLSRDQKEESEVCHLEKVTA